ncbi:hypothetical protein HK102_004194, partial [Quaeritorhiza haematococci]
MYIRGPGVSSTWGRKWFIVLALSLLLLSPLHVHAQNPPGGGNAPAPPAPGGGETGGSNQQQPAQPPAQPPANPPANGQPSGGAAPPPAGPTGGNPPPAGPTGNAPAPSAPAPSQAAPSQAPPPQPSAPAAPTNGPVTGAPTGSVQPTASATVTESPTPELSPPATIQPITPTPEAGPTSVWSGVYSYVVVFGGLLVLGVLALFCVLGPYRQKHNGDKDDSEPHPQRDLEAAAISPELAREADEFGPQPPPEMQQQQPQLGVGDMDNRTMITDITDSGSGVMLLPSGSGAGGGDMRLSSDGSQVSSIAMDPHASMLSAVSYSHYAAAGAQTVLIPTAMGYVPAQVVPSMSVNCFVAVEGYTPKAVEEGGEGASTEMAVVPGQQFAILGYLEN